ncbi:MAG: hypothetical protein JWR09_2165, partial [Mucilaginibacter sp.]|nr:hypothetical protein [Mucilaginibacter sp.]
DWLIDKQPEKALYYYSRALQEADRYKYPLRSIIFAASLYDYYSSKGNSKEALKYASIIMDADHKKEQELKKYNVNIMGFIIRDKDLKMAMENKRTATKLLVFFIILSMLVLVLLFVVYRSFRISKKYALLQSDLKERTEARNQELEQWNNFYDMLLSVLAHDLRQPFSSIIMTTDLLDFTKNAFSGQELEMIIRELKDTAVKSIELLHGILYWVKSKKAGFQYTAQPLLLYDMINEANSLYVVDQRKKNINVVNEIPKEQIIYGHQQMLLFICRNILNNAIKYTMPGSIIKVYTYSLENKTVVAFEDKGNGMSSEQLSKLFSINDKEVMGSAIVQGAGIALTIAHEMAGHMNGKLWAESEINKGTTFYLELPDPIAN